MQYLQKMNLEDGHVPKLQLSSPISVEELQFRFQLSTTITNAQVEMDEQFLLCVFWSSRQ